MWALWIFITLLVLWLSCTQVFSFFYILFRYPKEYNDLTPTKRTTMTISIIIHSIIILSWIILCFTVDSINQYWVILLFTWLVGICYTIHIVKESDLSIYFDLVQNSSTHTTQKQQTRYSHKENDSHYLLESDDDDDDDDYDDEDYDDDDYYFDYDDNINSFDIKQMELCKRLSSVFLNLKAEGGARLVNSYSADETIQLLIDVCKHKTYARRHISLNQLYATTLAEPLDGRHALVYAFRYIPTLIGQNALIFLVRTKANRLRLFTIETSFPFALCEYSDNEHSNYGQVELEDVPARINEILSKSIE